MVPDKFIQPKQKPALWEILFVVFVSVLSTGAIIPLIRKESGMIFDPVQGDMLMQGLWFGIYLITFSLLAARWRQARYCVYQDKLVWLLVGLTFVSVLWSEAPALTLRRSMALLGSSAFGLYLVTRFTWQELLRLIAWALGLCAVLSLTCILLLPAYGIHHDLQHSGAWRGIYVHKNALGRYMSLAAVTWLLYAFHNVRGRIVGLVLYTMAIALLFMSLSKTSIIVFILLLCPLLLYLYRLGRWRYVLPVMLITLFIAGSAILLKYIPLPMNLVQQKIAVQLPEVDLTLTGRTALWQASWEMVQRQPWLGYGYSAFWVGFAEPSGHIWRDLHWEPPNAHNGYLDLWLQLGLVGLIIFIILMITSLFKTLVILVKRKGCFEAFSIMFLLLLLINNISESFILVQNCIFWILYVAISARISIDYGELSSELIQLKLDIGTSVGDSTPTEAEKWNSHL